MRGIDMDRKYLEGLKRINPTCACIGLHYIEQYEAGQARISELEQQLAASERKDVQSIAAHDRMLEGLLKRSKSHADMLTEEAFKALEVHND